jgi:hypothetical protein
LFYDRCFPAQLFVLGAFTVRTPEKNIFELYAEDPQQADRLVFGRETYADRRGFLKGAGLAGMAALLGGAIPFHRFMPGGLIPVALAEEAFHIENKDGLVILNDRPVNAECPPHLRATSCVTMVRLRQSQTFQTGASQ